MRNFALLGLLIALGSYTVGTAEDAWVTYEGTSGPGQGKHLVFVSGDDEYRSEEALPMLARIMAEHHGFKCTVLFAINPETNEIQPNHQTNIPGLAALKTADLAVFFLRFRNLPDDQMQYVADYTNSGKPIVGMRTSTHAFNLSNKEGKFANFTFNRGSDFSGGWGRQVLGETWVNHHGHHGQESTRGIAAEGQSKHPILIGCSNIWGDTDV